MRNCFLGWRKTSSEPGPSELREPFGCITTLLILFGAFACSFSNADDSAPAEDPQQRPGRFGSTTNLVSKDRINPHWFHNNTRFWYRNNLRQGAKEFVLVDAELGTRTPAFDHEKLAQSLSKAAGQDYKPERLPFDNIAFLENGNAIIFKAAGTNWKCDLTSWDCAKTQLSPPQPQPEEERSGGRGQRRASEEANYSDRSPDGKRTAFIKDYNVFIRSGEGGKEIQLSKDGKESLAYGRPIWSPDSKTLIAFRVEPGERKEVYLVESSPRGGGRAKMQSRPYALPGDKFTTYELNVFDVATQKQVKPEVDRFEHEWLRPRPRWRSDSRHFMYQQTDRGHQRLRIIDIDSRTGSVRNIIDEKSDTFIWTAHTENLNLSLVNWIENSQSRATSNTFSPRTTDELIYVSERDGWRHLYLIEAKTASMKQVTKGPWVVRGIDRIDETKRQVWFRASGRDPDQDPYFIHYCRINFDGTGFVALTEANGNHTNQFSPDWRFSIDKWSRVDAAPVHELRRASDGKLICKLEEADITDLKSSGWEPPEVFVAKGRDGQTDIWGLISRPRNFDPEKKYPVIEDIYAGPQGSYVPKNFSPFSRYESLTKLGFIVVKVDGMGTANRSKAFHDVCWHNLKDAGFEDRILWMKAAAKKYPHMDISRVGVYGNSAGGQNAASAVLFHPEFYKVAVASCGCHDNRMDKASWNEQWMGYPVGPHYSESSNIDNAKRLRGKLFLIVGELDNNVPPESTLRLADALIKAGKDFDLLVIPGGGHGMGEYGQRRMHDYFVRNLLGKEPPDRNASSVRESSE